MSSKAASRLAIAVLLAFLCLDVRADNFCMDCLHKQVKIFHPDGSFHYTSRAVCCMFVCFSYEDFDLRDRDVGSGCLVCETQNSVVLGTYCCSNTNDLGCPTPGTNQSPGPRNNDGGSGGGGCTYGSSGVCPAYCASCTW